VELSVTNIGKLAKHYIVGVDTRLAIALWIGLHLKLMRRTELLIRQTTFIPSAWKCIKFNYKF